MFAVAPASRVALPARRPRGRSNVSDSASSDCSDRSRRPLLAPPRASSSARDDASSEPAAPPSAPPPRRAVLAGVAATVAGSLASTRSLSTALASSDASSAAVAASSASVSASEPGAILITGANSGVGFAAAKQLAAAGKRVVLACRTEAKGLTAASAIREKVPGAALDVLPTVGLEMTDLRATRDYASAFLDSGIPLDALVLNAGIMAVPLGRTAQGHEMHFGVNHLAHFLVQDALMPRLREAEARTGAPGALAACSSIANMLPGALDVDDLDWLRREKNYEKWAAYAASKAENLLLTDEAARREGGKVACNAFHPGIVTTNLVRYILPQLTAENRDPEAERATPGGRLVAQMGIRDADEGAKTHVWLASSEDARRVTGKFFLDPGLEYPGATRKELDAAQDWFLVQGSEPLAAQLKLPQKFFEWRTEENARKLWVRSEEMIDAFRVK